jgi:predicted membrane channel-forming protein YqfA (hemolysin III family)
MDCLNTQIGAAKDAFNAFIGSSSHLPHHLVDNEFITGGYRINHSSFRSVIISLFKFHNESVNVWSHLLGMLFFTSMIVYTCMNITSMKSMKEYLMESYYKA